MPSSVNPLSPAGIDRLLRKARRRVRLFLRGESPRHFFDIHDPDLVNGVFTAHGLPPLDGSPREVALRDGDPVLGESLYELREDVRREIPLALTPAQRGVFLHWFIRYGWHQSKAQPIEVCGVKGETAYLTRVTCADGSNPFGGNRQRAHASRTGSIGSGGLCGSIVDLYEVPCPEGSVQVFMDMYLCGPSDAF